MMSVDAQRLQDVTGFVWMVWSAPLQIAVALYMLYNLLGVSVFAGVGVMLALFPLNGVITKFAKKFQVSEVFIRP